MKKSIENQVAENIEVSEKIETSENVDSRAKAFVCFKEESDKSMTFVGTFKSLNDCGKQLFLPVNNLRPVLKGSVRMIQSYVLFYVKDHSEDNEARTGYETWLAQDQTRKYGDFCDELYFEKGYIRGLSTRLPMTKILHELSKIYKIEKI